jgi:hypothetical protein
LAARAGSDDDDDRSIADSSVYLDAADEDEERMGLVSGWSGPASTSGPSSHGSNASSTVWGSERDRQFSGKLLQSVETFRAAAEAEAAEASARGGTYGAPPRGQLPPLRSEPPPASPRLFVNGNRGGSSLEMDARRRSGLLGDNEEDDDLRVGEPDGCCGCFKRRGRR